MKLKKSVLIFLIFLILFLCIGSVNALENQTDDSGGDEIIGVSESPDVVNANNGTYTDLAARIDDAIENNGSVLYLPYDFAYNEQTDYKYNHYVYPDYPYYGILINNTLTINGNGHTISGSNLARIFTVNATGAVVTFNNITFKDSVGAICADSDLNVNDCTFINNTAIYYIGSWGAFTINDGNIKITNTTFLKNSALKGGAIHAESADTITITDSVFTNNTATGNDDITASGGAIYALNGDKLSIENCTFTNNNAIVGNDSSWGGAIDLFYGALINNSRFINNSAGFAGALSVIGGFGYNSIIISNSNFTNNVALGYGGGAIYNLDNNVTIQDCTFDGNKAVNDTTIYNEAKALLSLSNIRVLSNKAEIYNLGVITSKTNVTVLGNKTVKVKYGQDVILNATYVDDNGNLIYVNDIEDNGFNFIVSGVADPIVATYDNGLYTATYKVDKLEQKVVTVLLNYEVTSYDALLDVSPGDVNLSVDAPEIIEGENATITVTLPSDATGTVSVGGINETVKNGQVIVIIPNLVEGNYTFDVLYSGDVNYNPTKTNVTVVVDTVNGTYTDLAAKIADAIASGGVLYLPYDFAYDERIDYKYNHYSLDYPYYGILINNTLTINGNGHSISGSDVARIFTINATGAVVTFNNVSFVNSAGAITTESELCINDCTFINNTAKHYFGSWGAITSNGGRLTVINTTFVNNTHQSGGAINAVQVDVVTVKDSVFINNTASGDDDAHGEGGAIYTNGDLKLIVDNCVFIGNTALSPDESSSGGAINTFCESIITNSKFEKNNASYGGALMFVGGFVVDNIMIVNSTFSDNVGFTSGGAICNLEDNLTVQNCTFDGNKAEYGDAIYNDLKSPLSLSNNKVLSNKAEIYNLGSITSKTNVTILGNKTVKVKYCQDVTLNATFTDDNGNLIYESDMYGDRFYFIVSGVDDPIPATNYDNGLYTAIYRVDNLEQKVVSVKLIYDVTTYDGLLDVGPADFNFTIIAPDLTKYKGAPDRFIVTVTDNYARPIANQNVTILLNGKAYYRVTDENGTAGMNINLNPGEYTAVATLNDTSVNSKITVLSTVNGTDITKIFKNGTQYYATFKDTNGNYLANGTVVKFNINGVFYERKVSGDEGLARLNINLNPGEYIITAINPVNDEMSSNTVTVLAQITDNKDLTKYFRNDSQYKVKVLDKEGKAVGANETVVFNINGVMYKRLTDAEGYAQLRINLDSGEYTITADYNGSMVSNTIKVLPVITASDLIKKQGGPEPFKATIVDGQGKPAAGQNVTFNINGVMYHRTADSEGVARLNINLNAGKYIITSMYNGESIGNNVTVTN